MQDRFGFNFGESYGLRAARVVDLVEGDRRKSGKRRERRVVSKALDLGAVDFRLYERDEARPPLLQRLKYRQYRSRSAEEITADDADCSATPRTVRPCETMNGRQRVSQLSNNTFLEVSTLIGYLIFNTSKCGKPLKESICRCVDVRVSAWV